MNSTKNGGLSVPRLMPEPIRLTLQAVATPEALAAKLVDQIESCLGPATCRIVGGVSVDLTEKKPWEKKFAKSSSDE